MLGRFLKKTRQAVETAACRPGRGGAAGPRRGGKHRWRCPCCAYTAGLTHPPTPPHRHSWTGDGTDGRHPAVLTPSRGSRRALQRWRASRCDGSVSRSAHELAFEHHPLLPLLQGVRHSAHDAALQPTQTACACVRLGAPFATPWPCAGGGGGPAACRHRVPSMAVCGPQGRCRAACAGGACVRRGRVCAPDDRAEWWEMEVCAVQAVWGVTAVTASTGERAPSCRPPAPLAPPPLCAGDLQAAAAGHPGGRGRRGKRQPAPPRRGGRDAWQVGSWQVARCPCHVAACLRLHLYL